MNSLNNAKTIRITVGSKNPVKIAAAHHAIAQLFPNAEILSQGIHAPSGVADQPMTDEETKQGAINRAQFCQQQANLNTQFIADLYMAMEGGVDCFEHGAATFAYMAIIYQDKLSLGRSAQLPLPNHVYQSLKAGQELGDVMDALFNTVNIKQKGGAISLFTAGKATRESVYTQAIILAMAPFINPEKFLLN